MTTDAKQFSTETVMSVLTGKMMVRAFSDIHECISHVVGHDVWTHEMADEGLWRRAVANITTADPRFLTLPVAPDTAGKGLSGEAWLAAIQPWMDEVKAIVGDTVTLPKGSDERTKEPIETLRAMAPNAEVIVTSEAAYAPIDVD